MTWRDTVSEFLRLDATAFLRLDAAALALISHDVVLVPNDVLDRATPCEGWNVSDLLRHMNEQHDAVAANVLNHRPRADGDPRDEFSLIAARWVVAMQHAGDQVMVPEFGRSIPIERVMSIHFVDMLVHRWDLARALDNSCEVPPALTDVALPIARSITEPGSPLVGPGNAYRGRRAVSPSLTAMDNIAALTGRDPHWHVARRGV